MISNGEVNDLELRLGVIGNKSIASVGDSDFATLHDCQSSARNFRKSPAIPYSYVFLCASILASTSSSILE